MKVSDIEVTLVDYMGSDLSVVNAARVSFEKVSEWESGYSEADGEYRHLKHADERLIVYLAKHKHTSPFNHCFLTVRVKAPIFVARQLVKHKFMPWNEVSRRYVDSEPEFYVPLTFRAKAANVKQGSSETIIEDIAYKSPWGFDSISEDVASHCEDSLVLYNSMLKQGVCPEMARMVLPLNTMTEWIWSGTLGAFADMLKLRLDPHAQYESRIVAEKILEIAKPLFPVSLEALLGTE